MIVEVIKSSKIFPSWNSDCTNSMSSLPYAQLRKEIVEVQSSATLIKKHHEEEDEEEEDEENVVKDTSLPNYLLGSLSTDFGADTSLLTSQLELHSREEKINQIILLKVSEFLFF